VEPESWRWIWLAVAAVFAIGELTAAGTFFLLPFAIGAAVAAVLAFAGVPVVIELIVFIIVSVVALAAFRKLAHRLDRNEPTEGIGSKRLIGQPGKVIEAIDGANDLGTVRIDREEWRAESGDGSAIPLHAKVKVVEVRGTRVVVFPLEPSPADATPPAPPPPATD
jgi:membrane protein implicated in regulation of membrane protease activity